jgi:hypothetical protein
MSRSLDSKDLQFFCENLFKKRRKHFAVEAERESFGSETERERKAGRQTKRKGEKERGREKGRQTYRQRVSERENAKEIGRQRER